jgi:signal transduction histidine kinase
MATSSRIGSGSESSRENVLVTVAHDLRGPLNAIGLACDGLHDELTAADRRQRVAVIERMVARCDQILKEVMLAGEPTAATGETARVGTR